MMKKREEHSRSRPAGSCWSAVSNRAGASHSTSPWEDASTIGVSPTAVVAVRSPPLGTLHGNLTRPCQCIHAPHYLRPFKNLPLIQTDRSQKPKEEEPEMRRFAVGIWTLALSLVLAPASYADSSHGFGPAHGEGKAAGGGGEGGDDGTGIQHVLLISIDGMHALDFTNCAKGLSGVNGGNPYCPNLAALATHGVNYLDTSASKPSDSFPGLMAIVTGGSPRTAGAFYDVAYDRSLQPPALATGNGLAAGSCTPGQIPTGTSTEYEEGIDFDQTQLNGRAPSGDGGSQFHRYAPSAPRSRQRLLARAPPQLSPGEHDLRRGEGGRWLHGMGGQASGVRSGQR